MELLITTTELNFLDVLEERSLVAHAETNNLVDFDYLVTEEMDVVTEIVSDGVSSGILEVDDFYAITNEVQRRKLGETIFAPRFNGRTFSDDTIQYCIEFLA